MIRLNLDALAIDRAAVMERLTAAGVGASVHFIPLHLHPHYQERYSYRIGDFPVAEMLYEQSISLPIWPGMAPAQVDRVASTVLAICDAARHPVQV